MGQFPYPLQCLVVAVAGWINQQQRDVIAYLQEENRVLRKEHGLEPASERMKRTTWRKFLAAHWDVLAAADVFTVEVWMPRGLTRFTVLVLIELATRRAQVAGITAEPDGAWVTHLTRNATDAVVDRRD